MAKTCLDVITRALTSLNVLPAGDVPGADMAADAMADLQGMFSHLVETQVFGPLNPVLMSANYTPAENEFVSGAYSVTLPTVVQDAKTNLPRSPIDRCIIGVSGNVSQVDGVAVTGPQTWLYDARVGDWVALHDLALTDDCPLADRFFEGLAAMLAVLLSDDYSAEITARVADSARRGKYAIGRHDPISAAPVARSLLVTSNRMFRGLRY